jgi:hypothetical protein
LLGPPPGFHLPTKHHRTTKKTDFAGDMAPGRLYGKGHDASLEIETSGEAGRVVFSE